MHEQIVQKKIDGKLRLQKIQVPMKICKDPNFKPNLTPPSIPHIPSTKIEGGLQNLIDYCQPKKVTVGLRLLGPHPDFRPTKPSGEYYGMSDLTQEQRDEVRAKTIAYSIKTQESIVKFIKENNGKILTEDRYRTPYLFFAEIPTMLLKELEKRDDVVHISPNTKYHIPHMINKDVIKSFPTVSELIQKELSAGKDRIIVTIALNQTQQGFVRFVTDNGGVIMHQEFTQRFFIVDMPISFVEEMKQRKGVKIIGVTSMDAFDLCMWIKIRYG